MTWPIFILMLVMLIVAIYLIVSVFVDAMKIPEDTRPSQDVHGKP